MVVKNVVQNFGKKNWSKNVGSKSVRSKNFGQETLWLIKTLLEEIFGQNKFWTKFFFGQNKF